MKELLEILEEVKPGVDFEKEQNLIEDEVIDSFDIVTIVAMINERFDIEFAVEELTPENFQSSESLYNVIKKLQEK